MKKMISNIKTLAALLIVGAAFTACSSDNDIIAEQPVNPTEPQVYTLVIQATKGGDAQTRALSLNGKTLNAYWSGDEKIDVGQNGVKIGTATATASANGETTITATLTSEPTTADLVFYLCGGDKDYTGQVGLLTGTAGTSISEKYDYVKALLYSGNFTVSGKNVILNDPNYTLDFDENNIEQAVVKFTLTDKGNANTPIYATMLNIHDSKADGLVKSITIDNVRTYGDVTISPTSGTNVIYAALSGVYESNLTLTANDGENIYTYSKSGAIFYCGDYYEINVRMQKILARLNLSNVSDVLAGGYTAITADDATALAKQCWTVAGGTVYVVYNIANYMVYYVMTNDGVNTTSSSISVTSAASLYAAGSTAWFVEHSPFAGVTVADIGKVIDADGNIYDNVAAATTPGKPAVAMIAYVGNASNCTHGLAIALTDEEGEDDNAAARTFSAGTNSIATRATVSGGTWRMPSILDWQYMFVGCGATGTPTSNGSVSDYSYLNAKLKAAGATTYNETLKWAFRPDGDYWSSTQSGANDTYKRCIRFSTVLYFSDNHNDSYTRAVLAF